MTKMISKEYWNSVTITLFHKIPELLSIIQSNPEYSYNELKKALKWSNGSLNSAIRDSKNMGLISKNGVFKLTKLGEYWVVNKGKTSEEIPFQLKKDSLLNVSLFKIAYNQMKDITSTNKLFDFFSSYAPDNISEGLINSAVKRYLEGVYDINTTGKQRHNRRYKKQDNQVRLFVDDSVLRSYLENKGFDEIDFINIIHLIYTSNELKEEKKKILLKGLMK